MYKIAVYGKGGAGKSTVSANLSYLLSMRGRVLHVGCDPKHDSTMLLAGGRAETFCSSPDPLPVREGINGVSCIECGGASPGTGCAGKGLEMLFSRISGIDADYRVSDVLGDVVCGGFSVPARPSNCDAVVIVVSGEFMSLFAANNILRGLANVNPVACVMGLVLNRRGMEGERETVDAFAGAVELPVLCDIPRSPVFAEAESAGVPVCVLLPESPEAGTLGALADAVASRPPLHRPSPASDDAMSDIAAGRPPRVSGERTEGRRCSFDCFDTERNITYRGPMAVPSCTSHGAADAAMRLSDVATVVHGPANCAHLAEYAFRRRCISTSAERSGPVPPCNIYSSRLDAAGAFGGSAGLDGAVAAARADGFRHAFLVPTCPTEVMGVDIRAEAARLSSAHGIDVVPAVPDDTFLGSKFGGAFGIYRALAERMPPMDTAPDTVNLLARWFYGVGRDRNMAAIVRLLNMLGLRVNCRFLDHCTMDELMGFRSAEFDLQLGVTRFNDRLAEMVSEVTGRRRALALDIPIGLSECTGWVRSVAGYAGRGGLADDACERLESDFLSGMGAVRPRTEGARAVIYSLVARDVGWQVETLRAMGMDVEVLYADGNVVDHNERVPDLGVPVTDGADIGTLEDVCAGERPDVVVTNDPHRVRRLGVPRAPLGARRYGLEGAVEWASTVADCMRIPGTGWEAGL